MDALFDAPTLDAMCRLREVFDPARRANPGKVVPVHGCREWHGAPALAPRARAPHVTTVSAGAPVALPAFGAPRDVHETSALVREAGARGTRLRLVGRGDVARRRAPGRLPTRRCISRELRGIVDYVPGDLTLTARAGTPLARDRAASPRRSGSSSRWTRTAGAFGADGGTLGATVATASAGPLAHAFGTPRDNVLGLEFVTGDGDVVRAGGRVVKNVAGFDLVRLRHGRVGHARRAHRDQRAPARAARAWT